MAPLVVIHSRSLLQSPSSASSAAPSSTRVLGVGPGVFILGFFAAVCLSAVLLARSTKHRNAVTAGAAALYGFLLLILLTAERDYGDATGTKDDVGYETQFVGRVVILAFMVLYVLGGLCGWLGLHAALEVRAGVRPVGASAGRA